MDEECLKLSAYFGERRREGGRFVAETMLSLYEQRRVASSIALRGIAGFGQRGHAWRSRGDHRATLERRLDHLLSQFDQAARTPTTVLVAAELPISSPMSPI